MHAFHSLQRGRVRFGGWTTAGAAQVASSPHDWNHMAIYNKGAVLAIAGSALVSTIAVGASFAPSTFAAFTDTASSTANSATAGTLNIDVVDNAGNVTSAARVVVTNASPSMATRTYQLDVRNSGSLAASLRVRSNNLATSQQNLDDVLKIQVLDALGESVFQGKLSALDYLLPNLAADGTAHYTIKVTWPDDPAVDDNPYQGASLTFDLTADASVIAGQ
jgi:hypothetical protein